MLLASTFARPPEAGWRDRREAVGVSEMRLRSDPTVVDPWIARLGVASQARVAADAIVAIRHLVPDDRTNDGLGDSGLDRALHESAIELAADLSAGRGAPSPPCGPRFAASTLSAAEAAVELGRDHAESVTRSLLAQDWLLTTAALVDARP